MKGLVMMGMLGLSLIGGSFIEELRGGLYSKWYQPVEIKGLHILYFLSLESVPTASFNNFFHMLNRLQRADKDIVGYGIIRGFSPHIKTVLSKEINSTKIPYLMKFHPLLFRDLNITKVPSMVIAYCPKDFRYKRCDYRYRVDGDVGLDYVFKIVSKADKRMDKYHEILKGYE